MTKNCLEYWVADFCDYSQVFSYPHSNLALGLKPLQEPGGTLAEYETLVLNTFMVGYEQYVSFLTSVIIGLHKKKFAVCTKSRFGRKPKLPLNS